MTFSASSSFSGRNARFGLNTFGGRTVDEPWYGDDARALVIDFTRGRVWDGAAGEELTLADVLENSRAGASWLPDAAGNDVEIAPDGLPVTNLGLQVYEARTNLFANPDAPQSQDVTLTTGAHQLWIRGTGSVTLGSYGTATADTPLAFTAVSGDLNPTATVTGDMSFVQIEKGSIPTPAIHGTVRALDAVRPIGPLLAAFRQNECTAYVEWVERDPRPNTNRRFWRAQKTGGSGTTSHVSTVLVNGQGNVNASHTSSGVNGSVTSTAPDTPGAVGRAYAVFKAGDFGLAAQRKEYVQYNNQPPTCTLDEIDDWMLGRRNDNTNDCLNMPWRKLVIYPRALESYEMVDPDMTPVEPVPFVDYPAIETTGGDTAPVQYYDGVDKAKIGHILETSAGPRRIVVADGVDVVEAPYYSRDISSGGLTFQGNSDWFYPEGGGLMLNLSGSASQPTDFIIRNLQLGCGLSETGRHYGDRDCLSVHRVKRVVVMNCNFAYSLDELASVYPNAVGMAEEILFYRCIFGPALRDPRDGNGEKYNPQAPHNYGLLVHNAVNVAVLECLFVCNEARNPHVSALSKGVLSQNNLIYNWNGTGMQAVEPTSTLARRGATMAFRNNLMKPGPDTHAGALSRAQEIIRMDKGSAVFFSGNHITDGADFAQDRRLAWNEVALRNGGTRNSLVEEIPFGTPYAPLPVETADDRAALWSHVLDHVGVREMTPDGVATPGYAAASAFTKAVIDGVTDGTLEVVDYPEDFVPLPS
ncbi:hypothetical protein GCM10007276_35910 [Agaricicola taiwanensis]|uniref:Uncharacterized protein n=1 Tax=Agaricicola taiwanensis TaxID=591372 RepID=A0A8J3E118_9RHOB|nr:hypothetical protein [Agaricicola taiwanensis]GGE55664.1 hypothetical protein GCM10007276_35910 [Agaricicola taiwanensis]